MENSTTITALKEMLEIREFNKNFAKGVGEITYRKGENRLKQALDLGFIRTEDGEYLEKENNKISTALLNFRVCSDKTFNDAMYTAF